MVFGEVLSFLRGIMLGIISGVVPGAHYNLVGSFLFEGDISTSLIITVVAMIVSANFFEILRSVILFVPDEGTVLGMHPIFKMVREGRGLSCIGWISGGVLCALLFSVIASPILLMGVPFIFERTKILAPFVLGALGVGMIVSDSKRLSAILVFLSAGAIGFFGLAYLKQPFLAMLSGFFGMPFIFQNAGRFENREESSEKIDLKSALFGGVSAFFSAFFLTFVPAIGPSQASIFCRKFLKGEKEFLFSIGALSGFDVIFSIILLFSVGKARIGVLEMSSRFFKWDLSLFLLAIGVVLVSTFVSYFILVNVSKPLLKIRTRFNMKYLGIAVLTLLVAGIFHFDGFLGVLIFSLSALVGIWNNRSGAAMSNSMGCLIVPTMLNYII